MSSLAFNNRYNELTPEQKNELSKLFQQSAFAQDTGNMRVNSSSSPTGVDERRSSDGDIEERKEVKVKFSDTDSVHTVDNKKYYDTHELKHFLWRHPSEYEENIEELDELYVTHKESVLKNLKELGRELPPKMTEYRFVIRSLQQPKSTSPLNQAPLIEYD